MAVSIRSIETVVPASGPHIESQLSSVVPPGWRVQPQRPFRLLLTWSRRG